MNQYYTGNNIKLEATLKVGGTLTDSTTVRLLYKNPSGTVTAKESTDLTNSSTGVYSYNLYVNAAGIWTYLFESTGTVKARYQQVFIVKGVDVAT